MREDHDIKIVRVKNRLDPSGATGGVGGYRDCAFNIRFVSEEVEALGLDMHICEVQLILKQFYELKSDEGHARYVQFRNMTAE
eukprot:CAMPEP_0184321404 /NCGR_PEP_ID=MMETSP1049-20130417/118917_1 /TAXON_ID=77928 /ORGANISM="Proteomonas sulcata, Strain CCMP704" /LENGTH=82 /DNA_ID=CAMNT_0026642209 /DNA_START=51 /DNA_END=299 /DNA_ORIENTATION=-